MPGKRPTPVTDEWDPDDDAAVTPSRRAVRYVVPVAVAGVAAATIGLVPAFAGSGDPDLPKISAEELVAKAAASDAEQLSGTVKVETDLGLPSLPGAESGGGAGGFLGGGGERGGKGGGGEAADPQAKLMGMLSGSHTLRVAADGPEKQRVSIIDDAAEYSLIHNGDEVWAYDSATNSAYHATAPEGADGRNGDRDGGVGRPEAGGSLEEATPQEFAKQALKAVDDTTSVTVDGTARVAGRDAYQLLIKPKQSESTVGSIRIAVDAENGVPLKFTLSPKSGGKPVVDAGFTSVDFAKPDAKTFEFTPPKGADVTEQKDSAHSRRNGRDVAVPVDPSARGLDKLSGLGGLGEGWATVVRIKGAEGARGAGSPGAPSGKDEMPAEARSFMDSLGEKVTGKFGSGTVYSTRLINALMTDDGAVYVGAVDKSALVKAANQAK
ncbi:LolA family protein [Streptomyces sp. 7N604]|uniref:LolA family protein n=1 Tax=Streptomyces sp. 7N604 TaxID=3457415 RepID=UPI003FCEFCA1